MIYGPYNAILLGIPNKTDMAKIRKSPEFIAAQESMKPKSTTEKVDEFTSKIMPKVLKSFLEFLINISVKLSRYFKSGSGGLPPKEGS